MKRAKLEKYLVGAAKRHGKIKISFKESSSSDVSRERIITKKGSCVVRYNHQVHNGHYEEKWSRYDRSCFYEYGSSVQQTVNDMLDHDSTWLKPHAVKAGPGFKKTLRKFR